jgi:hypothetical protein
VDDVEVLEDLEVEISGEGRDGGPLGAGCVGGWGGLLNWVLVRIASSSRGIGFGSPTFEGPCL